LTFTASGALFQQTAEQLQQRLGDRYDASKNYPQYDGIMNIPADQAYALAQYLMNGQPIGERQELPIRISGWKKQSQAGKPYLSLSFKPDSRVQQAAPAPVAPPAPAPAPAPVAAPPAVVQQAAQQVATAFNGVVTDFDAEIPF
jgi:hypothetical protein